jgi:predicted TPR repeat methyltransferase
MKLYSDIYNNGDYEKQNPSWFSADSPYKARFIAQMIRKNALNPASICEVGCGNGSIIKELSREFTATQFLGIDISEQAIEYAIKESNERIQFAVADILHHENWPEASFDLILAIDLIEHLENYFAYLRKINSSGLYTMLHIPLDISIWTLFREKMLIESKDRVGHIHNFTESFIRSVLEDLGLKIIDSEYTLPNYQPQGTKAKFVFQLRKLLFKMNKRFCSKTIGGLSILILCKNNPRDMVL